MSITSNSAWVGRLLAGAAVTAALGFSTNAQAIEFGAGLIAGGGANFIPKPDPFPGGVQPNPGFGGPSYGGGLALDVRFLPFIGLEFDVLRKSDKGTGTFNNVDYTIGGSAWHYPIMVKAILPSPLVAPFAALGAEHVAPTYGDAEAALPGGATVPTTQWADSYWMFAFALGMEVKLPLPVVDIRIPISIRGSATPGASSKPEDRTRQTALGTLQYNAEWAYAFSLNAGAQIYF